MFVQPADLSVNYQACVTSGAITTIINAENGVAVDPDMKKKMIDTQEVGDMQTKAWDLVKNRDLQPGNPRPTPRRQPAVA